MHNVIQDKLLNMGNTCCGDRGQVAEHSKDKTIQKSISSTGFTNESQFSSLKGFLNKR